MSLFRTLRPRILSSFQPIVLRTFITSAPLRSDTPTSPILSRLRTDLKNAMRSKDTPRLNVLRALLAEITNASKTSKPIENDALLYGLLNKQIASSEKAVEEFANAKREDLVEKEQNQMNVLKGLKEEIPSLSREETDRIIASIVEVLKTEGNLNQGRVMKGVFEQLSGKVYDSKYVAEKVKELAKAES
ncbi:Yqey-like protein-domain-containing protein [Dendryphion nanum]|uniref:Altered inheritance of mitochondria protein 41 n=1 Tax=Dendryphion nanum TaxID=256645 RepID=A0A9P9DL35_9PLEO|nr:Yqey-like protein-domain-containing protein [Dendryphion nanum]